MFDAVRRNQIKSRLLSGVVLTALLGGSLMATSPAMAHDPYHNRYRGYASSYGERHPYIKKAALIGGTGALVGGVISPEGLRGDGMIKGALLGAGVGVGYEYLKRNGYIGSGRW